ncbi:MAG: hypothetical protein K2K48_05195 [Anaeroplasmataceae bacterium]|nr:hypothetical protein [Anaeroplasmataceae bacterium]MDE6414788.1 hypothetical protein [Anaeroplasmataceae bacterium]
MKKIALIFVTFVMVLLGLNLKANASYGPVVTDQVDSQKIYEELSKKQTYKGKIYKSGIIDNYHVVETTGVADLRKDQIICGLTDSFAVDSTSKTMPRLRINNAQTFVAFDQTEVKEAYAYTLLNGLQLCTDDYTTSNIKTKYVFYSAAAEMNLCSTSIAVNNANYTFRNIPEGTKRAQLLLKGDVIVLTVFIKNYQILWGGHDNNYKKQVNAYICCNTYEYESFM